MARTSVFENNFNAGLNGGSWIQSGGATGVGVTSGRLSLFTQQSGGLSGSSFEGGKYAFPSSLVDSERVSDFSVSMDVAMTERGPGATFGNRQPDGISFSFGNTNTFGQNTHTNISNSSDFEKGVSEGLSISIIPFSQNANGRGTLEIRWNGQVLAASSFTGSGSYDSSAVNGTYQRFALSVNENGQITASYAGNSVSATIPNDQWDTVDQSGWDFAIAGRTGGNGGQGYVDNLRVETNILYCFVSGTMIDCIDGLRAVETLVPGDLVRTRDHGYQPIRWKGMRNVTKEMISIMPQFAPIRIAAGALGNGLPNADLLVSPQHRVLVKSKIAKRMFGCDEVLVAAKQLCSLEGIEVADELGDVEYHHFLFDQHEIVFSNDAETESFFIGPQAMKSVGPAARAEILALFPELADRETSPQPARAIISGRPARKLAARNQRNDQPLTIA